MESLAQILTRYGSDKNTCHSYAEVYEELLAPARESIAAVLEVGVASGASLRAWRDWFPNAHITGLDNHADHVFEDRISTVRADSRDRASVDAALGPAATFDLIIDDGGHWLDDQAPTYENLWPRLRSGGVMVIEDLQSEDAMRVFANLGFTVLDRRQIRPRGDDVIAYKRRTNNATT